VSSRCPAEGSIATEGSRGWGAGEMQVKCRLSLIGINPGRGCVICRIPVYGCKEQGDKGWMFCVGCCLGYGRPGGTGYAGSCCWRSTASADEPSGPLARIRQGPMGAWLGPGHGLAGSDGGFLVLAVGCSCLKTNSQTATKRREVEPISPGMLGLGWAVPNLVLVEPTAGQASQGAGQAATAVACVDVWQGVGLSQVLDEPQRQAWVWACHKFWMNHNTRPGMSLSSCGLC
jgi:hypothetical protein